MKELFKSVLIFGVIIGLGFSLAIYWALWRMPPLFDSFTNYNKDLVWNLFGGGLMSLYLLILCGNIWKKGVQHERVCNKNSRED